MTIEERLERLEKENRRLKYLLFPLLFLIAGAFFIGATTMEKGSSVPFEIKAHGFTLVDYEGKVKGEFVVDKYPEGEPRLVLYNKEGKVGAELQFLMDEPSFSLIGRNGQSIFMYTRGPKGADPGITLLSSGNNPNAVFYLVNGEGRIGLDDKEGNPRVLLGVVNGEGCISLYNNWDNLKFSK
jgi:hypothetical protein